MCFTTGGVGTRVWLAIVESAFCRDMLENICFFVG